MIKLRYMEKFLIWVMEIVFRKFGRIKIIEGFFIVEVVSVLVVVVCFCFIFVDV